jgi:hypothetical protein
MSRRPYRSLVLFAILMICPAGGAREAPGAPWLLPDPDPTELAAARTEAAKLQEALGAALKDEAASLEPLKAQLGDETLTREGLAGWSEAVGRRRVSSASCSRFSSGSARCRTRIWSASSRRPPEPSRPPVRPPPSGRGRTCVRRTWSSTRRSRRSRRRPARSRRRRSRIIRRRVGGSRRSSAPCRSARPRRAGSSRDLAPSEAAPLPAYRIATTELELRVLGELEALSSEASRKAWQTVTETLEAKLELAQVAHSRKSAVLKEVRGIVDRLRAAELAEQQRKADEAKAAAEREVDPVLRYRKEADSLIAALGVEMKRERRYLDAIDLETNTSVNIRWEGERERLARRLEAGAASSRRAASRLLLLKDRVETTFRNLEARVLPQLEQDYDDYQLQRFEVQDFLFELALESEEREARWAELASRVPESRHAEAREVFASANEDLRKSLRARRDQLEQLLTELGKLIDLLQHRIAILDGLYASLLRQIYWVRTDDPIGLETFAAVPAELSRVAVVSGGAEVRREWVRAFREASVGLALPLGGAVLLILGSVVLGARLRGRTGVWSYRGGTILVALQRTGVALVLAAIVPGCLLLARILLGLAPVPYAVSVPLRRLLLGVAIVLFVRRVLWSLLRESGIAVRELGTPPAIAAQLLLAVRWAATVALFLVVPLTVLRARPYELEHLPRVLYTVTVLLYALLLIGLLSRKRPLLAEVLGSRGFWHQAWGFVGPMISVGLAAIVAMDVLGYRFGAGLLMGNVIQTFVVALILIGVYNVLTNFIEKAARRVFLRQRQEGAGADAYASSQEVLRRLTRFAGVTVILAAVVLLARFWGLADQLEGVFSGIHLTTVDAEKGVYLTAWNVLGALALILAGTSCSAICRRSTRRCSSPGWTGPTRDRAS